MDVLTNLLVVIISQDVCVPKLHIAHPKLAQCYMSRDLNKAGKRKWKGDLRPRCWRSIAQVKLKIAHIIYLVFSLPCLEHSLILTEMPFSYFLLCILKSSPSFEMQFNFYHIHECFPVHAYPSSSFHQLIRSRELLSHANNNF